MILVEVNFAVASVLVGHVGEEHDIVVARLAIGTNQSLARQQPAVGVVQPTLSGPIIVDPDTNLIGLPTNQSYAKDSLKGLFMQSPTGLAGVIWHNSAGPNSVIWLTHSSTPDNPATCLTV